LRWVVFDFKVEKVQKMKLKLFELQAWFEGHVVIGDKLSRQKLTSRRIANSNTTQLESALI